MSHTPIHRQLMRTLAKATPTRRAFLRTAAGAAAASAPLLGKGAPSLDVAIVGAGLAGLSCAYELKKAGVNAAVYEGSNRAGGRCQSLRGLFPGQVAEQGGELIDNLHKTMLRYVKEFRLTLEDVGKMPGEVFYYFDGNRVPESKVVEEFRAFVPAMRADLRRISAEPTADTNTPADKELDNINLRQYLESRGASPVIFQAIEAAYLAEYGREIDEQSCLNFLLFIHADRRSKFTPFGVFSDERYHIVEGNDAIAAGLATRVAGQIVYGKILTAVRPASSGKVELVFSDGSTAIHGAVVLTLPFSVLRNVDLSLMGLPAWKKKAIDELGYGDNAKMMIGFNRPYWREAGCDGATYSDLTNHQATWETNPTIANSTRAVLTDYSGGKRGLSLGTSLPAVQNQAVNFLADFDRILPGAFSNVRQGPNGILAFLRHWPSDPFAKGSYTCYRPGQFTTIAGNEGKRVGNVLFAGEHTNSFYEWQGFMEGALLSGIQAAADLLKK